METSQEPCQADSPVEAENAAPSIAELEQKRDALLNECNQVDRQINAAYEAKHAAERQAEKRIEVPESAINQAVQEQTMLEQNNRVLAAENRAFHKILDALQWATGRNHAYGQDCASTMSGIDRLKAEFEAKAGPLRH